MKINSINSQNMYKKRQTQNNTSFKGPASQEISKGLSKFYEKTAATQPYQKFIKNFSKSDKTFTHLLVFESCLLSGFYMINTLRNKKIEKEQKPQMIINDTLTLGVSTAGAYFAEDKITNAVMNLSEKYVAKHKDFYTNLGKKAQEAMSSSPKDELVNKVCEAAAKSGSELKQSADDAAGMVSSHLKGIVGEAGKLKTFQIEPDKLEAVKTSVKNAAVDNAGNIEKAKEAASKAVDDVYNNAAARKEADKFLSGMNKLKVLVIFGLIYRYLGPVVITPIANKLSSKFFENKNKKSEENKE